MLPKRNIVECAYTNWVIAVVMSSGCGGVIVEFWVFPGPVAVAAHESRQDKTAESHGVVFLSLNLATHRNYGASAYRYDILLLKSVQQAVPVRST